tara:strand:+ start:144 stop:461 length:318 start_codon:yes stop_codon:yes gene_type:complete
MNFTPIFLKTENELNKILRKQRKHRQRLGILFLSTWDEGSKTLLKEIKNSTFPEHSVPLYIVDSFRMPHAFVIFKTTQVPHLVQFKRSGIESEDYLSCVYQELGL